MCPFFFAAFDELCFPDSSKLLSWRPWRPGGFLSSRHKVDQKPVFLAVPCTRTPVAAKVGLAQGEELLQLEPEHLIARDLELAGEKELGPRGRVLQQLLEVVGGDRHRAVGRLLARRNRRAGAG